MKVRLLAALLFAGCAAPRYAAVPRPVWVDVAGLTHREGSFEGKGGVKLFEQSWLPAGDPKGVVIVVHGLRDHSSNYGEFATALVSKNVAVRAFDHRGHGSSEGARVWVDAFDDYVADLDTFVARVKIEFPGRRVLLFGHSMGGAIVALHTLTRTPVDGIVLSAAALKPGADVSGALIGITGCLATVTPSLAVFSLDPKLFSRDPAVVAANEADALVYQGNGPAHTADALLGALDLIQSRVSEVAIPVLALHGSADKITDPEGSKLLIERAKSTDKTLKIYDGLYHDLLHEPEKAQVTADILAWVEKQLAK